MVREVPVTVELQAGRSALQLLYRVLQDVMLEFPGAFSDCKLPAGEKAFRKAYPNFLPIFEAARLASSDTSKIARLMVAGLNEQVVWRDEGGEYPLSEPLCDPGQPLVLETRQMMGSVGWQPSVVYRANVGWPQGFPNWVRSWWRRVPQRKKRVMPSVG